MLNKNVTIFKNIGLGLMFLIGIVSCEKDFEDIAIDLIDNRTFSVGVDTIDIIAYSKNRESSRVDNNEFSKQPMSLLGVNQDPVFGYLKSDLISQIYLPILGVDFGENAVIDLVVLDIPYFATRDGEQDAIDPITGEIIKDDDGNPIQVPNFKLDSIYGNTDQKFNISVNELGTFLNTLDPENPFKKMVYYSDKDYLLKDQLFSGDFIANRNDTVLYVNRELVIIGEDEEGNPIHDMDTIKAVDLIPSMKFYLDDNFFKNRFIDHQNSSDFDSNDSFVQYFRGLYINANGLDGALMNLSTINAKMIIYYTNDIIQNEADGEDLNNNGVTGEDDVVVKTKQTMNFSFLGVRTGKYIRDYNRPEILNALTNPNTIDGEQKLYIQGAGGSEAIIDLFPDNTLEELRNKNWLINEANITIYLDGDQSEVPSKLFLYNYDYNSILSDLYSFNFGPEVFGGKLEYDDDGKPERYKFRITQYISEILNSDNPKAPSKLALKNHLSTDDIDVVAFDTLVNDFNWIPKGVVLKGNLPKTDTKKIQLEIYYSKLKE